LFDWLRRHADHPYPDEGEKAALSASSGLTLVQLRNWCVRGCRGAAAGAPEGLA
jgi:hypothetical protein